MRLDLYARPVPQRIRVVGGSGTGKTTFARALAARLALPHLELDAVNHREGWRQAEPDEFAASLEEFLRASPDGWVVDGSYQRHTQRLWDEADTVVWLDPPRWRTMSRVLRRTARRLLTRQVLWNGNREQWRNLLRREPEQNILRWAWQAHRVNRERYHRTWLAHGDAHSLPRWVRITSPAQSRQWLARVTRDG